MADDKSSFGKIHNRNACRGNHLKREFYDYFTAVSETAKGRTERKIVKVSALCRGHRGVLRAAAQINCNDSVIYCKLDDEFQPRVCVWEQIYNPVSSHRVRWLCKFIHINRGTNDLREINGNIGILERPKWLGWCMSCTSDRRFVGSIIARWLRFVCTPQHDALNGYKLKKTKKNAIDFFELNEVHGVF